MVQNSTSSPPVALGSELQAAIPLNPRPSTTPPTHRIQTRLDHCIFFVQGLQTPQEFIHSPGELNQPGL
ncbi:MAG: hypothetical protein AAF289_10885 [Cyanobacteria bacterium P01_A01_bin.135]